MSTDSKQDKTDVEATRTPGPWEAKRLLEPQWVVETKNTFICLTLGGNDRANAAFIVRAVNAHDELLEACEAMLHRFDHIETSPGDAACNRARNAIAKATGKDVGKTNKKEN